ncbi:unnamed protein product [Closterium sp. NIES-54]
MRRFSRRLPQVVVFFLIVSPVPTTAPNESSITPGGDDVPPHASNVPPDASDVPPDASDVPPDASDVPPDASDVPPDASDVPPDASDVPPDASAGAAGDEDGYMEATPAVKQLVARLERVAGDVPPDASDVPPDASDVPPDASDVPPDASDVPPDASDVPPDASDVPPDASAGAAGDEDGYMEATPAVKQLVARLERVAGSMKNPWEVLMHLDQLFAADASATLSGATSSGAVGAASFKVSPLATGCAATKAQMLKEVSRLAWRLHFRPIKYTIMGRFFRNIATTASEPLVFLPTGIRLTIKQVTLMIFCLVYFLPPFLHVVCGGNCAEKNNGDLRYLGCRTYLIPSNFAFMNMIAKGMGDVRYLVLAPLYNTINATYHFDRLRRMPHGATMPTLIPGYPIAKYFTPVTPLALITLGGSIVAVGTPGAKTVLARLGWAQIKDRDIHCGKYLAAHGVSTLVIPRIKFPK